MATLLPIEIKVGNWFIYNPEGVYCILQSKGDIFIVEVFQRTHNCNVFELSPIQITSHILPVCGFHQTSEGFSHTSNSGITLTIYPDNDELYLLYQDDQKVNEFKYVHQLQNAYFEITEEHLQLNLYGVKE